MSAVAEAAIAPPMKARRVMLDELESGLSRLSPILISPSQRPDKFSAGVASDVARYPFFALDNLGGAIPVNQIGDAFASGQLANIVEPVHATLVRVVVHLEKDVARAGQGEQHRLIDNLATIAEIDQSVERIDVVGAQPHAAVSVIA